MDRKARNTNRKKKYAGFWVNLRVKNGSIIIIPFILKLTWIFYFFNFFFLQIIFVLPSCCSRPIFLFVSRSTIVFSSLDRFIFVNLILYIISGCFFSDIDLFWCISICFVSVLYAPFSLRKKRENVNDFEKKTNEIER